MITRRRYLIVFPVALVICVASATTLATTPLLIITNRTLIDNQFIFGRNSASPPTLSKRVIDTTHRGAFGLSPSDSRIIASTSIGGGIMTGNPELTFTNVGEDGDTINRTNMGGGSWISDGFATGQYIFVKNTISNNVMRALLKNVTATTLTLDATPLTNETASGVIVRGGDRFVTVEGFGTGLITDGRYANVAGLTIDGNQAFADPFDPLELALSNFGSTYKADGVALDGEFPTAQNLFVQNFRGIGIAHYLADGRVFDCVVRGCHTGVKLPSSDTEISRCRLYNCRDACLWIAANSGNCQSLNNHCYGAQVACYNEGGGPFRATNDTYADAWIGYLGAGNSDETVLTNCLFQHNSVRDVVFRAGGGHLVGCVINVMREVDEFNVFPPNALPGIAYSGKVGIQFDGDRCSIRGGSVELLEYRHPEHEFINDPSEGIWINGDHCTVETNLVDSDEAMGENEDDASGRTIGIRILGARKGVKIDVWTLGFHQEGERILIIDDPANCDGLDITLRISGIPEMDAKTIDGYVDIEPSWTGSIRFINTSTGEITPLSNMTDYGD